MHRAPRRMLRSALPPDKQSCQRARDQKPRVLGGNPRTFRPCTFRRSRYYARRARSAPIELHHDDRGAFAGPHVGQDSLEVWAAVDTRYARRSGRRPGPRYATAGRSFRRGRRCGPSGIERDAFDGLLVGAEGHVANGDAGGGSHGADASALRMRRLYWDSGRQGVLGRGGGPVSGRSDQGEVAKEITASGGHVHAAVVDALDDAAVNAYVDSIVKQTGSIDVVFNAVGPLATYYGQGQHAVDRRSNSLCWGDHASNDPDRRHRHISDQSGANDRTVRAGQRARGNRNRGESEAC
jgi:hypothetical protein